MLVANMLIIWLYCCHFLLCTGFSPSELPEYCADDISSRGIVPPPLTEYELSMVSSLEQVQLLMRHGARVPWSASRCWKGYNVSWTNCKVHVVEAPSVYSSKPSIMQFRKVYDGSENQLAGTCQLGQLLFNGYEQAQEIGLQFRKHYVGPSPIHLLPSFQWHHMDPSSMYFQSDDEERTLLTSQAFLMSFFEVSQPAVIDWHTGDDMNPMDSCPHLELLSERAFESDEFSFYNRSIGLPLEKECDSVFGHGYWSFRHIFDCVLTTICSKRDIPLTGLTGDLYTRILNYTTEVNAFKYRYNNAAYARLYSGWILNAIVAKIKLLLENSDHAIKFSLQGMHDSDISGLLAVVLGSSWDKKWPPYASTVTIEVYRDLNDRHIVRFIYNGDSLILSCAICKEDKSVCSSLCYADDFINLLFVPNSELDTCTLSFSQKIQTASDNFHTYGSYCFVGNNFYTGLVFFTGMLGGLLLFAFYNQYLNKPNGRKFEYSTVEVGQLPGNFEDG